VLAVARKDFRVALSYRLGFVLGIGSGFSGLVVFRILSKLVNGGQFAGDPTSFFKFTVVGIVIASVVQPAATAAAASVRTDQVQGTLEFLAAQPIPRVTLGLGWSAYAVFQALVQGVVITALTIPLGFRVSHVNLGVALLALVLTLAIFLAVGNIGAAVVLAWQQGGPLVTSLVAVVGLLSGTLFPVNELPGWVRPLAHLSPLTYSLNALRSALLSHQPMTSFGEDLAVLLGFAIVLFPLSGIALRSAFRYAQRRGTLSTF